MRFAAPQRHDGPWRTSAYVERKRICRPVPLSKLIVGVVITTPEKRVIEVLRTSGLTLKLLRRAFEPWLLLLEPLLLQRSRFAVGRVVFQPGHVFLRSSNNFKPDSKSQLRHAQSQP